MEGDLFQFAILLGVLSLAAAISIWLRLPVVPLYIAAGVVIGGIFPPSDVVQFLGFLGVAFLLFSMGLEFSLTSVLRAPERLIRAGSIDWLLNFPIGLMAGYLLGWSWIESLFLAGILYMSSSAVVSKCVVDFGRATRPETETILNIMVFEDLAIAAYLVLVHALVAGGGAPDASAWSYTASFLRATLFIAALIMLARSFHEPLARLIASRSEEAFTLALFAFVLLVASVGMAAGLSAPVGAFLAGLVIGSTADLKERAAATLLPFQTLFAALFFVSFGMALDLRSIPEVLVPGMLLVVVGVGTKILGGYLGGRSAGHPSQASMVVGLSLVPKGEFSILIASLAASVAPPDSHIEALTGLYVFALSILGPIGMREADRITAFLRPQRGD